jgi:hypothetical protein
MKNNKFYLDIINFYKKNFFNYFLKNNINFKKTISFLFLKYFLNLLFWYLIYDLNQLKNSFISLHQK